ncbi:tRNA (adenosine(37)-N6)-threonylcarbamoyltransferase complex ATPase subunit type 1 TsaE [Pseudogracilibacillus sp. SO30301A]|uniref:tRNA (adenosine(37)-N6)-threonylcarbamoyltransferase complex ATPase subunit type 1 TsaE n=1 Tax=Pseudogracilibacillus sp. SO30301A TaxID=3098291 RepID=UPI00300E01C6
MIAFEQITDTENETIKIGTYLASLLEHGDVITLEGDLGVGKTTFTKGIAKGLGIKRAVTSPTFTIIKEYDGEIPLYHMDAYRLEHSDEDIGFDEYFFGNGVSVVEWASFITEYLPEERLIVKIEHINLDKRKLTLIPKGKRFENVVLQLREHCNESN